MRTVSKGLFVFAGLVATPMARHAGRVPSPIEQPQDDARVARLQEFLEQHDCPINDLAVDFIQAADDQDLDWRLLPSIAFVESSGGKNYTNNNVFGWASCKRRFPSVRAGIHLVAERLGNSNLYKDKDIDDVLRTYNPERTDYPRLVKSVMRSIAARENLN